jgi:hypothetical protein
MLMIERDKTARAARLNVRAVEPGMGRGPHAEGLTLKQAHLCLTHYYGAATEPGNHHDKPVKGCPWCKAD